MSDQPSHIKRRKPQQTVCDEPGAKETFCSGHLKVFHLAPPELVRSIRPEHRLFRCQRCGQLYEGEPLKHLH